MPSTAPASCCSRWCRRAALPLRDLAAAAGMPAAKAFPHLVSLQKIGLLSRDDAGCFGGGPLGQALGLIAMQRVSPTRDAEAEIVALAGATDMSVAAATLGPLGPTVIRLEESARPQHVSLQVGTVMSLVNTAIGRIFAAGMSDDVLADLLANGVRLARRRAGRRGLPRAARDDPRGRTRFRIRRAGAGHRDGRRARVRSHRQHPARDRDHRLVARLSARAGQRPRAGAARRDATAVVAVRVDRRIAAPFLFFPARPRRGRLVTPAHRPFRGGMAVLNDIAMKPCATTIHVASRQHKLSGILI